MKRKNKTEEKPIRKQISILLLHPRLFAVKKIHCIVINHSVVVILLFNWHCDAFQSHANIPGMHSNFELNTKLFARSIPTIIFIIIDDERGRKTF